MMNGMAERFLNVSENTENKGRGLDTLQPVCYIYEVRICINSQNG